MSIISEKPDNIASTNALDRFAVGGPAEVRLGGKTLCVLADPPDLGSDVTLMVKLRVVENCVAEHADGELVYYRKCKLVGAYLPGSPPPVDTSQPELWDQAPPEGSIAPEVSG